jgi:hypothetical protein
MHDLRLSVSARSVTWMGGAFSAAIDRRLEALIIVWARREWLALRLLPVRVLRPAVAPTVVRLRRVLTWAVAGAAMLVAIVVGLLVLKP